MGERQKKEGEKGHACIVLSDLCSTVKGKLYLTYCKDSKISTCLLCRSLHCSRKCFVCSFTLFTVYRFNIHAYIYMWTHAQTHTQIVDPKKVAAIFNLGFHSVHPKVMHCSGPPYKLFPQPWLGYCSKTALIELRWRMIKTLNGLSLMQSNHMGNGQIFFFFFWYQVLDSSY